MAFKLKTDPKGSTRQLGRRGALKQSTFIRLEKNPSLIGVESAMEVMLLSALDLSNEVTEILYQPFTIDVANDRLFKTHEELAAHRSSLRQAGMTGVFYTPDIQVTRWFGSARVSEVIEAKDSDWLPTEDDQYRQKLSTAQLLLEPHGIGFDLYEASNRALYKSPLAWNIGKLHSLKMLRRDVLDTLSDDYNEYLNRRDDMLHELDSGPKTVRGLASTFGIHPASVWHLLIDELASTDLRAQGLGPASVISSNQIAGVPALNFYSVLQTLKVNKAIWLLEATHA